MLILAGYVDRKDPRLWAVLAKTSAHTFLEGRIHVSREHCIGSERQMTRVISTRPVSVITAMCLNSQVSLWH